MQKWWRFAGFGLIIMFFGIFFAVLPVSAQVQQPVGEDQPETLIRVFVTDLNVQGVQTPEAVREAFNTVLPQVVSCIEAEYVRTRKLPNKIMLRFNLNSNGKAVWSKVIDPPLKSLEVCISKVLLQMQSPPAGTTLSRVTLLLEARIDHLLAP
jgi:hypothetical protein